MFSSQRRASHSLLPASGGIIASAMAGFVNEIELDVPWHLTEWFDAEPALRSMHSSSWWRMHWERSGIVDVEIADSMPDGWKLWTEWLRQVAPENKVEIQYLETDGGRHLTYNRAVGRRRLLSLVADLQLGR